MANLIIIYNLFRWWS